ncbi:MAG: hypothetical protein M1546_05465, partial [Chloroflexi bacterium]|nr:hypothetical protein [Chloroflexota bacterium]
MSTLATLVVKLVGDIGGFSKSMDEANSVAEKANTSLVSKLGGGLATVGKAAVGIAAAGIITATTAITGSMVAAGDWAGTLDSLGDVMGTTANESATMAVAIRGVGGDVGAITGQVAKLATGIYDSKGQLSEAGKLMQGMGIKFADAQNKLLPAPALIANIADKISQMPDGLQKTEAMMTLFGKSGKDMTDTLNALTSSGLAEAEAKAKAFGLAIGDDAVNATIEMGKSMADLEMMGQGLAVSLGGQLLPVIVPIIQQFTQWAVSVMPAVRAGIDTIVNAISPFISLIYNLIYGLGAGGDSFGTITNAVYTFLTALGIGQGQAAQWAVAIGGFVSETIAWLQQAVAWVAANWPQIQAQITGAFEQARTIVEPILTAIWTVVSTIFGAIVAFLQTNGPQIEAFVGGVWQRIQGIIAGVLAILQATVIPAFEAIAKFVSDNQQYIQGIIEITWGAIKMAIEVVLTVIEGLINTALNIIKGDWKAAWESFKGIATGVWDAIQRFFAGIPASMVELGKNVIDGLIKGLENAADAVRAALVKIIGDAIGGVKEFLGIHSPSTAAGDIGDDTILGFVKRILAGKSMVEQAMTKVASAAIGAGDAL